MMGNSKQELFTEKRRLVQAVKDYLLNPSLSD